MLTFSIAFWRAKTSHGKLIRNCAISHSSYRTQTSISNKTLTKLRNIKWAQSKKHAGFNSSACKIAWDVRWKGVKLSSKCTFRLDQSEFRCTLYQMMARYSDSPPSNTVEVRVIYAVLFP